MIPLTRVIARCLIICSLLFAGCSDDSEGPSTDAQTDGSAHDQGARDGAQLPDAGALSCKEMEQVYLTTLELARVCQPRSSVDPCTALVKDRIVCGCDTAVNVENSEAIAKLRSLRVTYENKKCASSPCSAQPCTQVMGDCTANPRGSETPGHCEDS